MQVGSPRRHVGEIRVYKAARHDRHAPSHADHADGVAAHRADRAGDVRAVPVEIARRDAAARAVEGRIEKILEEDAAAPLARDRIEIKTVTVRRIPPPTPPPFTEETPDELAQFRVVMETSQGNIVIEMLPDKAPNHVRHFLRLTSLGAYDNSAFHRVAPGFVIQAGDLNTRKEPIPQAAQKYVLKIRAEINDIKHKAGIVSMARGEEIDSALTSFFIVLADQPALDGTYTVFGRVVEGMDVVGKIAAVRAENERPAERVDIYSMKAERRK